MNIFEKLKNGEPVDKMSEEYRPAVAELHRADRALFHLNHTEPHTEEWSRAFSELFDGEVPDGLGIFTPTQIDFPKQLTFGKQATLSLQRMFQRTRLLGVVLQRSSGSWMK